MDKVKLEEKDQKDMKGLSKTIYIIGCILKVCSIIGIVVSALLLISSLIVLPNINVNVSNNTIKLFNKEYKYELNTKLVVNDNIILDDLTSDDVNHINDYLNNVNSTKYGLTIIVMISIVCLTVFAYKLFEYLEKLFRNFYNLDTPFKLENAEYIRKIAIYLALVNLVPDLLDLLVDLIFNINLNIEISLLNYLYVLIILAFYYVFKYGYEMQLNSDAKMYGNK